MQADEHQLILRSNGRGAAGGAVPATARTRGRRQASVARDIGANIWGFEAADSLPPPPREDTLQGPYYCPGLSAR